MKVLTRFGWFVLGVYSLGIILLIFSSYFNIGSSDQRIRAYIFAIIGVCITILFSREKVKKNICEAGGNLKDLKRK